MHVQYEMIPCSGFIEEVLSVDADADRRRRRRRRIRRTNSARISHPPPFRRVSKKAMCPYDIHNTCVFVSSGHTIKVHS